MTITYEIVNTDTVSPWPYRRPLEIGEVRYTETPEPPAVNPMDANLLAPSPKRKRRRSHWRVLLLAIVPALAIVGAAWAYGQGWRVYIP